MHCATCYHLNATAWSNFVYREAVDKISSKCRNPVPHLVVTTGEKGVEVSPFISKYFSLPFKLRSVKKWQICVFDFEAVLAHSSCHVVSLPTASVPRLNDLMWHPRLLLCLLITVIQTCFYNCWLCKILTYFLALASHHDQTPTWKHTYYMCWCTKSSLAWASLLSFSRSLSLRADDFRVIFLAVSVILVAFILKSEASK